MNESSEEIDNLEDSDLATFSDQLEPIWKPLIKFEGELAGQPDPHDYKKERRLEDGPNYLTGKIGKWCKSELFKMNSKLLCK